MPEFTPTQKRIIDLLSDGMAHSPREIHGCLDDELAAIDVVRVHVCHIRKKLRPIGQDILREKSGYTWMYRQVRLLASAVNGYR